MKEFVRLHLIRKASVLATAIAVAMIIGSQFLIAQAQCVVNPSAYANDYQALKLPKRHYEGAREIKMFESELALSVALHQRSVGGSLTDKQQSLLARYDAESGLVSNFEAKMHHRQMVAKAAAAEAAAKGFQPNLLVAPANDTVGGAQVIAPGGPFPFLTTTVDITVRNTNTSGLADIVFTFGAGGLGYIPVAGDYNNDGTGTVGLYQPTGGVFMLTNTNATGPANITFGYGPGGADFRPVVGDWNGDGTDTIGVVAVSGSSNGAWFLRNSNTAGVADITPFTYGPGGGQPIAGDWTF